MEKINIGERLRRLRKSLNMTTQELADKINISQSYISRFENNRAIPDIDMLSRILFALGTDLSTFFTAEAEELSEDIIQLIETAKKLSPEERKKLNEFLKVMKNLS
ncbi:helix-turn-helix domain-containing protein [Bacillus alveayuensis]|jgi:transcriptional regulator with XRE-family HTH domain|uniref:helix-turn-helix domain-containing protein n=1 Tax=Aeribacillus alveayuensis TaxID=279215 RepID=UPI0005D129CF|nr:helix-turn-helix transcriptional regulator [Bacillus alveayuensis]